MARNGEVLPAKRPVRRNQRRPTWKQRAVAGAL